MFMLSLIFVSFQVEANLSNYHVYICIDIGDKIVKRRGGLGSRGKVDWDAINPATLDIPMTYRSLQVYQRSYSQVGHRVLSDFTLKIVRQNQFNIVFYNKIYTIKNVSC